MSILTIAQNVAKEIGFTAPTSLVGNADEIAIQMLALIKAETFDLSNGVITGESNPPDFNWQILVKRGTFNFVASQEAYTLPTDFKDFIPKTIWNYSTRRPLIAPVNAEDYEIQKNYLITTGIDKMIYVYGGQMYITPVPSSTDTINYEYSTTYIYQSSGGTGKADITLDTDVTTIPEKLIQLGVKVRYLVAKGLIPSVGFQQSFEYMNYNNSVQRAILKDGFGRKSPLNMNNGGIAWWKAAYTQYSDYPAS
jgi:hypothetical protein